MCTPGYMTYTNVPMTYDKTLRSGMKGKKYHKRHVIRQLWDQKGGY